MHAKSSRLFTIKKRLQINSRLKKKNVSPSLHYEKCLKKETVEFNTHVNSSFNLLSSFAFIVNVYKYCELKLNQSLFFDAFFCDYENVMKKRHFRKNSNFNWVTELGLTSLKSKDFS